MFILENSDIIKYNINFSYNFMYKITKDGEGFIAEIIVKEKKYSIALS